MPYPKESTVQKKGLKTPDDMSRAEFLELIMKARLRSAASWVNRQWAVAAPQGLGAHPVEGEVSEIPKKIKLLACTLALARSGCLGACG